MLTCSVRVSLTLQPPKGVEASREREVRANGRSLMLFAVTRTGKIRYEGGGG